MPETVDIKNKLKQNAAKAGVFAVYDIIKIIVAILTTFTLAATLKILPWPTRQEVEQQAAAIKVESRATFETRERNEAAHEKIMSTQENLKEGLNRIEVGQDTIMRHLLRQSRRGNED